MKQESAENGSICAPCNKVSTEDASVTVARDCQTNKGGGGGTLNNNKVGVNSPDPRIFNKRRVLMNRGRWKIENYVFVVTEHKQAKTKYGVQKFRN